jgi:hypothetical protein
MTIKLGIELSEENLNRRVYRIRDRYILTLETYAYAENENELKKSEKPLESDNLYTLMFENVIERENGFNPIAIENSYIDRTIDDLGTISINKENEIYVEPSTVKKPVH